MLNQVEIKGRKRYGDVLDVVEHLAGGDYGSAANALAVVARRSPLFQTALAELQNGKSTPRDRRTV